VSDDRDRQTHFEELRFAKKQQWNVAAYVMALLGAMFSIAHAAEPPLQNCEKWLGSLFAALAAMVGAYLLYSLQSHLQTTRRRINPRDDDAFHRGTDVLYPLQVTLLIGAAVVIRFFWR
jgi:hypothetical protein